MLIIAVKMAEWNSAENHFSWYLVYKYIKFIKKYKKAFNHVISAIDTANKSRYKRVSSNTRLFSNPLWESAELKNLCADFLFLGGKRLEEYCQRITASVKIPKG